MTDTPPGLIASKIAKATARSVEVTVSLRGDLRDRYDDLTRQIVEVKAGGGERLGDPRVAELERERESVQREAAQSGITFTLRAIAPQRARAVQTRLGKDADQPDRNLAVARACIVRPKPTDQEWAQLFVGITRPADDDDDPDDVDDDGYVHVPPLVAGGDQADLMLAAQELVWGNAKSVPTLPGASAASRDSSTN